MSTSSFVKPFSQKALTPSRAMAILTTGRLVVESERTVVLSRGQVASDGASAESETAPARAAAG